MFIFGWMLHGTSFGGTIAIAAVALGGCSTNDSRSSQAYVDSLPRKTIVGRVATEEDYADERRQRIEEERRRAYAGDRDAKADSSDDEVPTLSPIGSFGGGSSNTGGQNPSDYSPCQHGSVTGGDGRVSCSAL